MIFSLQRYIEDYLVRRSLSDIDQYSVRLANLYDNDRSKSTDQDFLKRMKRIRTVLFLNNTGIDREDFEAALLKQLDSRFKKKTTAT